MKFYIKFPLSFTSQFPADLVTFTEEILPHVQLKIIIKSIGFSDVFRSIKGHFWPKKRLTDPFWLISLFYIL